jgi:quercetin dioxygenase-like cupin family protein
MSELIRHIKFPKEFDVIRLKSDLQKIIKSNWVDHYNQNDYVGKWTSIALMSSDGKSDNIYAFDANSTEIKNTEILESCLYFKEILDEFQFKKTAVRLLSLAAGAEIKPHSDHCLGYEDGYFRLHIPIITNSEVEFILDNQRLQMNEGECWYINANFTHAVANRGTEDRIHLVIDGIRNDWSDELFFKEATKNQFEKPKVKLDERTKALMIEQLKLMNNDAANTIIKQIESES